MHIDEGLASVINDNLMNYQDALHKVEQVFVMGWSGLVVLVGRTLNYGAIYYWHKDPALDGYSRLLKTSSRDFLKRQKCILSL